MRATNKNTIEQTADFFNNAHSTLANAFIFMRAKKLYILFYDAQSSIVS